MNNTHSNFTGAVMGSREQWLCRAFGMLSGLLLMVANVWPVCAPLQMLALIPMFSLGASGRVRRRGMLVAGMYMGLVYTLPQVLLLRLPAVVTLVLIIQLTILMVVFAWVSAWFVRRPGLGGAFAAGALLVLLDWLNVTAIPLWGTGQSLVRCWSRYPKLVGFVCVTGITGIIFSVGTLQALAVKAVYCPRLRRTALRAMAVVFLVFAAADMVVRLERPVSKLKVAAVGWVSSGSGVSNDVEIVEDCGAFFAESAAKAADAGAKLIVSPEMGFYYGTTNWDSWVEQFASIARRNNLYLAIGYLNCVEEQNRLLFMNPQGQVVSEYSKTYLTVFEDFRKGDGELAVIDVEGIRVGGMICHDDNFSDLSRKYGLKRVGVVAVPTLDWLQVKDAHLYSSIYRGIECRYAIVRAAMNGISAIIAPTGEVLARMDHFTEGPGVIMAEVPVYACRTLFSIFGNWPVVPSSIFLVLYLWRSFGNRVKSI